MNPRPSPKMDELADLLAEGLTVRQAADRIGITYDYANAMFQRMRARIGEQAR